jgi:hypothetical protein
VVEAALSRARVRPALVAVWAVLAGLVVVIVALELRNAGRLPSGTDADLRLLMPVPVDELGAIEIAETGRLHRFERDAAGTWFYHGVHAGGEATHTHTPDPALAQRIERAIAAFARTRTERQFALERDANTYGVATPDIVVLLYRPQQTQPLAQYAVGSVAPDTVSRYVMVVGHPVVFTIPGYQIDNLLALVQAAGAASASTAPPGGSR